MVFLDQKNGGGKMKNKLKMIVGIALVLGVVSIALLAAPIQAYVNGAGNSDLLQTQDRDSLRTKDCGCNCDMLQTRDQVRDRLRTYDCDCNCTCDGTREQSQIRQRTNECVMNGICNCTTSLEQYRYQHRERTRNLAP